MRISGKTWPVILRWRIDAKTEGEDMARQKSETTQLRKTFLITAVADPDVTVHELAARFKVSLSTIRRDLAVLEASGEIVRTYGGAVKRNRNEPTWHDKELINRAGKDLIAQVAASRVHSGDVVLLDAGTTVARVAQLLSNRKDLTIITNGLSTILTLADSEVDLHILPGRLRRPNEAILGAATDEAIRNLTPDIVFLGADHIDPTRGINCPDMEQAALKKAMAECARNAWVLADRSKFLASPKFAYWAPLPTSVGLITNATPSDIAAFKDEFTSILFA